MSYQTYKYWNNAFQGQILSDYAVAISIMVGRVGDERYRLIITVAIELRCFLFVSRVSEHNERVS